MSKNFRKKIGAILAVTTVITQASLPVMGQTPKELTDFNLGSDFKVTTGSAIDVTTGSSVILKENFDDLEVGSVPTEYIISQAEDNKEIDGKPIYIAERAPGDNYVHVGQEADMKEGENKGKIRLAKDFEEQTDVFTVSFDFMVDQSGNDTTITLHDGETESIRLEMRNGCLAYRYYDDAGENHSEPLTGALEANEWVRVQVVVDLTNQKLEFYVNGKCVLEEKIYTNSKTNREPVEKISRFMTQTPKSKVIGHGIDNLSIVQGVVLDEEVPPNIPEKPVDPNEVIAFPGAEGGGRFATGGRGQEVYIITTLEDYKTGETPIQGSLRDAVSQDNRMIVFNVSGTIQLKERLKLDRRKNITIAGQSAPGDGITVGGYETTMNNAENVIIRYMRFRPGSDNVVEGGDSMDALWGRDVKNCMIDHVSTSWSTDETLTIYRGQDTTVQWSITNESLAMSGHTKGRHGYGMIVGGENVTYHHNLVANHTSRAPRLGGGTPGASDENHIGHFDFRNNVIYNWGFNGAYGGGYSHSNFINNYLKAGAGTRENVRDRVIDVGEKGKEGKFYVDGNYVYGYPEITADNSLGIYISEDNKNDTEILTEPIQIPGNTEEALGLQSAEEAYEEVLAKVGATYPRRDALDARVIQEVKDGTGRFANKNEEVGGFPVLDVEYRADDFDTDCDGIPDEWEISNSLDPSNPEDSKELAVDGSGYTNIENYLNSLVDMDYAPTNPDVSLVTPVMNQNYTLGETITVEVDAEDNKGIAKVELFNGDKIIATKYEAPYIFEVPNLGDGTYFISAKATDTEGNATQATASVVHVNTAFESDIWRNQDIGEVDVEGSASVVDGTITVKGAGKFRGNADTAHFVYQVLKGDGEIIAKLDSVNPADHHLFSGLMIRESLDANAAAVVLGLSATKGWEYKETNAAGKLETLYRNPWGIYLAGREVTGGNFDKLDENLDSVPDKTDAGISSGVSLQRDVAFRDATNTIDQGYYLKLVRTGDVFTAYSSADGKEWYRVGERTVPMGEEVYIGLAADGNQVANEIHNVNTAKFSEVEVSGEIVKPEQPEQPEEPETPETPSDEEDDYVPPTSGGSTSAIQSFTQKVAALTTSQKEAIQDKFNEYLPYTSLSATLSLKELKSLTNNLFTEKQLQEIIDQPSLLTELGVELDWNVIALSTGKKTEFKDIATKHWAYEAVQALVEKGMIQGFEDSTFKPNQTLKVADAFTLLDRVLLSNGVTEMSLSRSIVEKYMTQKDSWAFAHMASVASKLSETTLKVVSEMKDAPLTRGLVAQVLYEVTNGELKKTQEVKGFIDLDGSSYKEAINYCVQTGLLKGVSETKMNPEKAVTRAELTVIIERLNTLLQAK